MLFLFGKVEGPGGSWVSCCAQVPSPHRSLLVVPDPELLEDSRGELAAAEAAAKEDPTKRIDLLKMLHVRAQ